MLEREADVQTFEQMSELHTTEHRVAAISIAGVLAIMIVAAYCTAAEGSWRSAVAAYCTHVSKYPSMAAEDCPWRGAADSPIFLIIWHTVMVLTRVTWMGS